MTTLYSTDRCSKCKLDDMQVEYIEILANDDDGEMIKEKVLDERR